MQIDWRREVNEATAVKLVCDQCGRECASAVYANRRLYCPSCAAALGAVGREVSYERIMRSLMLEMRVRLDEWAGHLETLMERRRGADYDPVDDLATDWHATVDRYRHLEEQYLALHRAFRRQGYAIPKPGWRSAYVERVIACGFRTKLGD